MARAFDLQDRQLRDRDANAVGQIGEREPAVEQQVVEFDSDCQKDA